MAKKLSKRVAANRAKVELGKLPRPASFHTTMFT